MNKELIELNFSQGIKAPEINYNFDLIHDWIKRERKRLGGHGIVEGFDMKADIANFTVTVGAGVFINKDGEEINVDEKTFYVGAPESISLTFDVDSPDSGIIELPDKPYSPTHYRYLYYVPPKDGWYPDTSEFKITDIETGMNVPILQISNNRIYINARDWRGSRLRVAYKKAEDRIDSIMLTQNGKYKYEKSVISTSPSHVQIDDYEGAYMIGAVYWSISDKITATFYDNHRTYRTLYVDEQNRLWINGELYEKPRLIYFIEPDPPKENDLWYDKESNTLYIWREDNGIWGWTPVNDNAKVTVRSKIFFHPEDKIFPKDVQTFRFPDDRMDLRFIPNSCALEIIIDNQPLMSDQYTEILSNTPTDKPYMAQGIGFKLVQPLDRPTIIECIVHHQVKGNPANETFQRAAIFVSENFVYHNASNTDRIYETQDPYTIGEDQLEVYLDGVRLIRGVDFYEMIDNKTKATPNDLKAKNKMSSYFKINKTVREGQCISYKISKHIWNYDQVHNLIRELEEAIVANKNKNALQDEQLAQFNKSINDIASNNKKVLDAINAVRTDLPDMSKYVKKTDKLTVANLDASIQNKFIKNAAINVVMSTTMLQSLVDLHESDFIQIFYNSPTLSRILVRDRDYTLVQDSSGLRIELQQSLIKSSASLYINGIKLGA